MSFKIFTKHLKGLIFTLMMHTLSISATEKNGITIDTVISFKAGYGQNAGQESQYFPSNIFGLPNRFSSDKVPETSPHDILSLGMGGEIIVSFKNYTIIDGEGIDFVIFENAFINPVNRRLFAEPAIVSVSYDGINFIEFPYNYETLIGCAGINPTFGDKNPFDFPSSGGDGFDLSVIGINEIKYIKIRDITETIYNNRNHLYYDAVLSGFDLDAVVGLNYKKINDIANQTILPISLKNNTLTIYNTQTNNNFNIDNVIEVKIYNIIGNEVVTSITKNDYENIENLEIYGDFPQMMLINIVMNSGIIYTYNILEIR